MIVNDKATKFINKANDSLKEHLSSNPKLRFIVQDWEIVERGMRLGIEARALDLTTTEEIESVALATLKNDFIKNTNG